jgi:adenylosuccinate synthase
VLKYSASVNYYTAWNLTKLDVLDTFPTIKVAVAYKDPKSGNKLDYFPADLGYLESCEVVYREFEGWQKPTTAVKKFVRSISHSEICLLLISCRRISRGKRRYTSDSLRSLPVFR